MWDSDGSGDRRLCRDAIVSVLVVVCIAAMGAATTAHGISCQTLMQNSAAPAMVGRVLNVCGGMITRAAPAMGALIYGAAAEVLGLRIPVLIGVGICAVVWARTWLRLHRLAPALEGVEAPAE